jgi:hypothetical protein
VHVWTSKHPHMYLPPHPLDHLSPLNATRSLITLTPEHLQPLQGSILRQHYPQLRIRTRTLKVDRHIGNHYQTLGITPRTHTTRALLTQDTTMLGRVMAL